MLFKHGVLTWNVINIIYISCSGWTSLADILATIHYVRIDTVKLETNRKRQIRSLWRIKNRNQRTGL